MARGFLTGFLVDVRLTRVRVLVDRLLGLLVDVLFTGVGVLADRCLHLLGLLHGGHLALVAGVTRLRLMDPGLELLSRDKRLVLGDFVVDVIIVKLTDLRLHGLALGLRAADCHLSQVAVLVQRGLVL